MLTPQYLANCSNDIVGLYSELDSINSQTVEYDGKTLSRYEAEQQQRANERNIRRWKKESVMLKEVGLDNSFANKKVREWNARAKDFTDKTGIPRQIAREKVFTGGGKSGIIDIGRDDVGIDIQIDKFTPCLIERKTGTIVNTRHSLVKKSELKGLQKQGWNFNWTADDLDNADIYKLTLTGDERIQGLVALTDFPRDKAIYVNIAESAPWNMGNNKQYEGIGGHLFAIAAETSNNKGYGGFLFMDAKNTDLVSYYKEKFGAVLLGMPHPYRMYIDEETAQKLLGIYTLKGE